VARHPRGIPHLSRKEDQEKLSTFAQTIKSTFAQSPTHLGIVDDDTRLIENLRFLLQSEPGVQAVHSFATAEEFLAAEPRPELDILLVDMDLPGLTGVELIARITAQPVTFRCLAYTISAERQTVLVAVQAGACGYVLKGGGFRELVSALHDLAAGGAPMSPGIARQVLQ
jgi:DNA-binding NarL/FixJ family response regulator